jgi:hypothetical protein
MTPENGRARLPLLLFILLLLLFFHKMVFSNLILARGDTFLYFYPYWQAAADALANGRVPLWNNAVFMGSPLLANSQMGFFYPLNWPLWLLLPTPYAVSASIVLHVAIAGLGAYVAARRTLGVGEWAGLVTAVLFALGGYLTAQVEHINQLQGLAWLPWYFVVLGWCADQKTGRRWVAIGWAAVAFAGLFVAQLLAGHSQTAFISGVGVVAWLAAQGVNGWLLRHSDQALRFSFYWGRLWRTAVPALLVGGGMALLVTAVQLLPTLELTQYSSRQGGLSPNEVLSFSLHPLLLTRALFPHVGQSLFSEYVVYFPLTALLLAFVAAWQWKWQRGVLPAVVLVLLGFFLALGLFNPANWLVARLPGFNLFRVPARWLVLAALGISLLAGLGWQIVLDRWQVRTRRWEDVPERAQANLWHVERPLRVALFVLVGLMAWGAIAGLLAWFIPTGPEAPFASPRPLSVLLWVVEIGLVYVLLMGQRPSRDRSARWGVGLRQTRLRSPWPLLALMLLINFWASRSLPYNNLTTPEAYFDLRPPITRLQALGVAADGAPPGRFLSLSNIFFDVGDQAEIDTIYADQLPPEARYDYTVAIKHKEIISPNLPMIFGLAAMDGFDGGVLPLAAYSRLMSLLLPENVLTSDGRLREYLTAVPTPQWLDVFSVQTVITDKTGDVWLDGVFYDRQHPVQLGAGESVTVGYVPAFTAAGVRLLTQQPPAQVVVTWLDGAEAAYALTPLAEGVYGADFGQTAVSQAIAVQCAASQPCDVQAITLTNEAAETFQPVVAGQYRLIHSGDVKIYENLDVRPRVQMFTDWRWEEDETAVWQVMNQPTFDPRQTAVLLGAGLDRAAVGATGPMTATIRTYEPERIVVDVQTAQEALLMLTEAAYPGWEVAVNGSPISPIIVDLYFQGVILPVGSHQVTFTFAPDSYRYGRWLTMGGLLLFLILIGALVNRSVAKERA